MIFSLFEVLWLIEKDCDFESHFERKMERVPLENRANVIQCTTFACFGSKRPLVIFTRCKHKCKHLFNL